MRTARIADRPVSAIGCGDVSLAIAASRGVDRGDVERALTSALELGLTVVDVHPGEDDAERLAGQVVRALRLRDSVVTATSLPLLASPTGRDTPSERLPPAYVQARVEAALRHTRLDALPLAQLPVRPAWVAASAWPELAGTAARLVREGKVLAWGARLDDADLPAPAGHGPDEEPADPISDELRALIAEPWLASLSLTYNLCVRAAEPLIELALAPVPLGPAPPAEPAPAPSLVLSLFDVLPPAQSAPVRRAARSEPLAILARHPLAGGALGGGLGPGVKLAQRDDRGAVDARTLDRIALEVARLAPLVRMPPPAARSTPAARDLLATQRRPDEVAATTLGELALRYVLDRGAIALPRLHRHEHVPEALLAESAPALPASTLAWLADRST